MNRWLLFPLLVLSGSACGADASEEPPRTAGDTDGANATPWPEQDQRGEAAMKVPWDMPAAGSGALRILVANVGNIDFLRCADAVYKLCAVDSERAIQARIEALAPDVVLLSEVLPAAACAALEAPPEPWHVCHPSNLETEPEQVRRLLGPEFSIACDPRNGYECVAVRISAGHIAGCPMGALCPSEARVTPQIPGCDPGFTATGVTAHLFGQELDVVVAHPQSGLGSWQESCRQRTLALAIDPACVGTIRRSSRLLLGGDLNFDPWRGDAESVDVAYLAGWASPRRGAKPLSFHSGVVEHDPPYWTLPLLSQTMDHVLSSDLIGRCMTLGASPDQPPLDDVTLDPLQKPDHLAELCQVEPGPPLSSLARHASWTPSRTP